jgi:hypothetical protein
MSARVCVVKRGACHLAQMLRGAAQVVGVHPVLMQNQVDCVACQLRYCVEVTCQAHCITLQSQSLLTSVWLCDEEYTDRSCSDSCIKAVLPMRPACAAVSDHTRN